MEQLIPSPSSVAAFKFGWGVLPEMLRKRWLVLLAIAIAGTAVTTRLAKPDGFHSVGFEWLAMIAVLPLAVRFAVPNATMTLSTYLTVIAYYLCVAEGPWLFTGALGIFAAKSTIAAFVLLGICIVGFPFLVWVTIKTALTPAYYVMDLANGRTVWDALRRSWNAVSGDRWWTLLWLQILVGLCAIPIGIVAMIFTLSLLHSNYMLAAAIGSALYYLASVVIYSWIQASLVAFATVAEQHTVAAVAPVP